MHALIKCPHARSFWDEAQSWLKFSLPRLHPSTWPIEINLFEMHHLGLGPLSVVLMQSEQSSCN
jgi:hypothetical protein